MTGMQRAGCGGPGNRCVGVPFSSLPRPMGPWPSAPPLAQPLGKRRVLEAVGLLEEYKEALLYGSAALGLTGSVLVRRGSGRVGGPSGCVLSCLPRPPGARFQVAVPACSCVGCPPPSCRPRPHSLCCPQVGGAHEALWFGTGCLFRNASKCYPAGHKYQEVTSLGLNRLLNAVRCQKG